MRIVVCLLVASLAGGCVSKARFATVESQLDTCRERLQKHRDRNDDGKKGERDELAKQLQPLIDRGVLEVEDVEGRTVIGMRSEVLFPSGSAELSNNGRATIVDLGRVLAARTEARWQVEGHTDNAPIATAQFPSNWDLGAARSLAVLKVMLKSGMSPERVSAATFGEFAPVASNASDPSRALNRRIEVVLLPEAGTRKLRK